MSTEDLLYIPEGQKQVTTEFSQTTWNRARELGWNTPDRKLPEVPPLTFGARIKENPLLRRAIEFALLSSVIWSIYEIYTNWDYFFNEREHGLVSWVNIERNKFRKSILNDEKSSESDKKAILVRSDTPLIFNVTYEENRIFVTFVGTVLSVAVLSVLIHRFRHR